MDLEQQQIHEREMVHDIQMDVVDELQTLEYKEKQPHLNY